MKLSGAFATTVHNILNDFVFHKCILRINFNLHALGADITIGESQNCP